MSHVRGARNVYYYALEGSRYLFADERDKMRILEAVLTVSRMEGWPIYAFCIMDHCAYFVMEAEERSRIRDEIRFAAEYFLNAPGREDRRESGDAVSQKELETLGTLEAIAERCCQIHRLPLEHGLVTRLEDYWWSSYLTYVGGYEWEQVDCRLLFMYFSAGSGTAARRMRRMHSSAIDPFISKERLSEGRVMQFSKFS